MIYFGKLFGDEGVDVFERYQAHLNGGNIRKEPSVPIVQAKAISGDPQTCHFLTFLASRSSEDDAVGSREAKRARDMPIEIAKVSDQTESRLRFQHVLETKCLDQVGLTAELLTIERVETPIDKCRGAAGRFSEKARPAGGNDFECAQPANFGQQQLLEFGDVRQSLHGPTCAVGEPGADLAEVKQSHAPPSGRRGLRDGTSPLLQMFSFQIPTREVVEMRVVQFIHTYSLRTPYCIQRRQTIRNNTPPTAPRTASAPQTKYGGISPDSAQIVGNLCKGWNSSSTGKKQTKKLPK